MSAPKTNPIGRPPLPASARADSQIQLRVTRRRKSAYVRAANQTKSTLAAWCFTHLDRASGHKEA
jgi:hypothetical protein